MMVTKMRYPPDPPTFARMNAGELRNAFLIESLFEAGNTRLYESPIDRAIIGASVPLGQPLILKYAPDRIGPHFTERREIGVINIGGAGVVRVGAEEFLLEHKVALYIGRGIRDISFCSTDPSIPAQFYFVSYPAHAVLPCFRVVREQAEVTELGCRAQANRRVIHKLIHPAAVASCQLVMGYTELAEGSVWNTMPAHTHGRRSEVYCYFDLPDNGVVVHCLGDPGETRHIIVRNRQAVISPEWSVHFGAGTSSYSFVWAMGGENQEFSDMDAAPMETLA